MTADLRRDPQPLIYAPSDIPPFIISLKMQDDDILHLEISSNYMDFIFLAIFIASLSTFRNIIDTGIILISIIEIDNGILWILFSIKMFDMT